jgi:glutathione S-transferase
MAEYIDVAQARNLSGLRLVLSPGVPGPWSEAAKGIFYVKKFPYVKVRQEVGGPNLALQEWTAQASAPVAVWNDEPPRSTWIQQLYLAERLAPTPPLIPAGIEDRLLMFGYSNEICGETGFGWSKRLMLIHAALSSPQAGEAARTSFLHFGQKYGYTPEAGEAAPARVAQILQLLGARLEQQRRKGSKFFIGDQLSALDIYWATFAAIIQPLPHELCPMPQAFRSMYTNTNPVVQAAVTPLLLEQRDFIYHTYLELPIDL